MALEFVGSRTATASGSLSLTSLTGGIDTAPAENDIVFVAVSGSNSSDQNISISGYTEVADLYANSTFDINFGLYYKVMGASPDTTVTIPSLTSVQAVVYVWRGQDVATPADATATTSTATNTPQANPPAITTVTNGAVVIAFSAGAADGTWTAPSGYSNVVTRTSFLNSVMVASKAVATAGSQDPGQWTTTADPEVFSLSSSASVTFALRPAASGINGTATLTQAGDTVSASGLVGVAAAASITQSDDTVSTSGSVGVVAAASITQGADSVSASGVGEAATSGSLAQTQGADTAAAVGTVSITGLASLSQGGDVSTSASDVSTKGTLAQTQAGDTLEASNVWQGFDLDFVQNIYAIYTTSGYTFASVSVTQAGDTLATANTWQEFALDFVQDLYAIYNTSGYTRIGVSLTQAGDTVAALGTAPPILDIPCVLRADVVVHGIVAATVSYIDLSTDVSYTKLKYGTCWDVVAGGAP